MTIVLVTGSRGWNDPDLLYHALDKSDPTLVIQGGARGADLMARQWCDNRGVPCVEVPALWTAHGKGAGPKRNQVMLDLTLSLARDRGEEVRGLAFPTASSVGTWDMVERMKKAGVRGNVYRSA